MAKQYTATKGILGRAENKIKRVYQQDCGFFDWRGRETSNLGCAVECLEYLVKAFESKLAEGHSEEDALELTFSAYNRDALSRNVSQKNRDLMREAMEMVIAEAKEIKEDSASTRRHRDTRPWWLQQEDDRVPG